MVDMKALLIPPYQNIFVSLFSLGFLLKSGLADSSQNPHHVVVILMTLKMPRRSMEHSIASRAMDDVLRSAQSPE